MRFIDTKLAVINCSLIIALFTISCGQTPRTMIQGQTSSQVSEVGDDDRYLHIMEVPQRVTLKEMRLEKPVMIRGVRHWVVAGDILVSEADFKELKSNGLPLDLSKSLLSNVQNILRAATQDRSRIWPQGRIQYSILRSSQDGSMSPDGKTRLTFSDAEIALIRTKLLELRLQTGLTFVEVPERLDAAGKPVFFDATVLLFPTADFVCGYANVGYFGIFLTNLALNLRLEDFCDNARTIQHEFIHSLGFHHAHQSFDRNDYLKIHDEALAGSEASNITNFKEVHPFGLGIQDFASIMHYDSFQGAKCVLRDQAGGCVAANPAITRTLLNSDKQFTEDTGIIGRAFTTSGIDKGYLTNTDIEAIRVLYQLEPETQCTRLETSETAADHTACSPAPLPDLVVPEFCVTRQPAALEALVISATVTNVGRTAQSRKAAVTAIGRKTSGVLATSNPQLSNLSHFLNPQESETVQLNLSNSSWSDPFAEIEVIVSYQGQEIYANNNSRSLTLDPNTLTTCATRASCVAFEGAQLDGVALDCNDDQGFKKSSIHVVDTSFISNQYVNVSIAIANAPNDVGVFSFHILYDPNILSISKFFKRELTSTWDYSLRNPEPGLLIVSGTTLFSPIARGQTGNILTLGFQVLNGTGGITPIQIANLGDGIATYTHEDGLVELR